MPVIKFPSRKLNKKKMIICISVCSIALIILVLSIIYNLNSSFRAFMDIYIFRKEIKSDNEWRVRIFKISLLIVLINCMAFDLV